MVAVTNELMYELLKKMNADIGALKTGQAEIRQELVSIRGHIHSTQNDINNIYGILARHDERLDRIESRLELRELAEAQAKFEHDT
ncbi:MAG: hypothetical protein KDJ73_10730 [Notoacmeibacter sp.]|nr:hypothetical protein [Notoacmeibacter sp.]MCC0032946.1 hypothetical protein [Brucellaceae bacterium]